MRTQSKLLSVREDSFFLEESYPIGSLPHPRQEESFLQRNETDDGPISIADKPLQLREKEESSVYLSVDKNKIPFSLSQGREFLTISSCSSSSTQGREPTIKKKGWSSSKFQALARELWSSLRHSKGNEKSYTSSSEPK